MTSQQFSLRDTDPEAFDRMMVEFCYRLFLKCYAKHLLELSTNSASSCLELEGGNL